MTFVPGPQFLRLLPANEHGKWTKDHSGKRLDSSNEKNVLWFIPQSKILPGPTFLPSFSSLSGMCQPCIMVRKLSFVPSQYIYLHIVLVIYFYIKNYSLYNKTRMAETVSKRDEGSVGQT
jgi:hypothetical protein